MPVFLAQFKKEEELKTLIHSIDAARHWNFKLTTPDEAVHAIKVEPSHFTVLILVGDEGDLMTAASVLSGAELIAWLQKRC